MDVFVNESYLFDIKVEILPVRFIFNDYLTFINIVILMAVQCNIRNSISQLYIVIRYRELYIMFKRFVAVGRPYFRKVITSFSQPDRSSA